ncbi:MAG: hypothetical protein KC416_17615 [Myxococcales bacterium]|nr:hypothetical protein [Myxococcales bacterium]
MSSDQREKWTARVARMEEELALLDRQWAALPKWWKPIVATVVPLAFWSLQVAVLVLFAWLSLLGVTAWILGVRRRDHRASIRYAQEQVKRLSSGSVYR